MAEEDINLPALRALIRERMDDPMPPGAEMKRVRHLVKLSLLDVADAIDIDKSTLVKWEAEVTTPSPPMRARYLAVYELMVEELNR